MAGDSTTFYALCLKGSGASYKTDQPIYELFGITTTVVDAEKIAVHHGFTRYLIVPIQLSLAEAVQHG